MALRTGSADIGNLTVSGEETNLNSAQTTLKDDLIILRAGEATADECGIAFERGSTGDDALLLWNEADGRFELGLFDTAGGDTAPTGALAVVSDLKLNGLTAVAVDSAAALAIGNTNATSIVVGRSGITTDFPSGSLVDFTGATVSGLDAGGGPPTQTAWGGNAETLSATKTLVDGDETVHIFDTGGAARDVVLPIITTSTPYFVILNNQSSSDDITLKNANGITAATLTPGDGVRVWVAGTIARVEETFTFGSQSITARTTFEWGSNNWTSGDYGPTNHYAGADAAVLTAEDHEHVVTEAGSLKFLSTRNTSTGATYEVWINGSLDTTTSASTVADEIFSIDISVVQGDTVAVTKSGGASGGTVTVEMEASTTEVRTRLCWGSSGLTSGQRPLGNGAATDTQVTGIAHNRHTVGEDCDALYLSWSLASNPNETIGIYLNGSLEDTITIDSAQGSASLAWPVTAGDTLFLEADGTIGAGTFAIELDAAYQGFSFGAHLGSSQTLAQPYLGQAASNGTTAGGYADGPAVARAGKISSWAMVSSGYVQTGYTYAILKNGVSAGVINPGNFVQESFETFTEILFDVGDTIGIRKNGTWLANYSMIELFFVETD